MANSRTPGPLCQSENPEIIDDGTMCRAKSDPPGSVCSAAPWDLLPAAEARNSAPPVSVDDLFVMCMAPLKAATDAEIEAAAKELDVEPDLIRAVEATESAIDGRKSLSYQGRATILFERHKFRKFTGGLHDAQPDLSNQVQGGYGSWSSQYPKLERAFHLDEDAALKAASWGKYQILGENYGPCGYKSPRAFVEAMINSEQAQLDAFVSFVKSKPKIHQALKKKDWAGFAKGYNGPAYEKNQYDQKLKSNYEKIHKSKASGAAGNRLP
jgi:hypothetical protein